MKNNKDQTIDQTIEHPSTTSYHHGNLEQDLITTGIRLVQETGIEKLSLRKLAKLCGVSEAAPYSHFKNKEELLLAMQNYITDQLLHCLQTAAEQDANQIVSDSVHIMIAIGKAYVLFFLRYPEYYTFLFSQLNTRIDLSANCSEDEFPPFLYFKKKAYEVYRKAGLSDERIKYGIIAMWGKVHGIAAIASLKTVVLDFDWETELDKILIE